MLHAIYDLCVSIALLLICGWQRYTMKRMKLMEEFLQEALKEIDNQIYKTSVLYDEINRITRKIEDILRRIQDR